EGQGDRGGRQTDPRLPRGHGPVEEGAVTPAVRGAALLLANPSGLRVVSTAECRTPRQREEDPSCGRPSSVRRPGCHPGPGAFAPSWSGSKTAGSPARSSG